MIISNNNVDSIPIAVLVGIQVLGLGILMIWLGVIDRKIEKEYKKTLSQLRQ